MIKPVVFLVCCWFLQSEICCEIYHLHAALEELWNDFDGFSMWQRGEDYVASSNDSLQAPLLMKFERGYSPKVRVYSKEWFSGVPPRRDCLNFAVWVRDE